MKLEDREEKQLASSKDSRVFSNEYELPADLRALAAVVVNMLARHGLEPDRVSTTNDGSRLLQFFKTPGVEAAVDIFPNGDIVVIVRKNGLNTIYEATSEDLNKLPGLLMDAGAAHA